jgi:hypothetical protein
MLVAVPMFVCLNSGVEQLNAPSLGFPIFNTAEKLNVP